MPESPTPRRRLFATVAWATLGFNVLVVLGGTIVRATGSGDGCGESWPKCGDQFIPPNPTVETLIEFSHRLSSFMAGLGVLAVVILAYRSFSKGDPVRKAAVISGVFLIVEALLGAALVLYGWVDDDVSVGRMIVVPLHLANTYLLLGALTLTAWWGTGYPTPQRDWNTRAARMLIIGAITLVILGATGALNALADTVFPSDSIVGDLEDKFGPTAPLLSRLRVVHPALSVIGGMFVAWIATGQSRAAGERSKRLATVFTFTVLSQMFIGIANIFFFTPLSIQVIHLMVADAMWIVYVVFGASLMGEREAAQTSMTVTA